ncbi:trigger factor [Luteolibacter sp. LG18]|uniref:trigger factor n=1 Tax=Luteolibacter sp. LG18 TaxID=2819286 RepID=UPI0030C712E3
MNIVVEKQPKCVATLRVEIPAEQVSGERERIVAGYTKQAKLPGFRPGKAPRKVIEKRYEKEISEELRDRLMQEGCDEALRKESLKVLDFGVPESTEFTADGGFSFSTRILLAPEITLPEYKGIPVKVPAVAVPDEELNKQLDGLRERFADFNTLEGRALQTGDFAVIDYTSTTEGKPLEEFLGKPAGYIGGREGFWVRINDDSFLPGFAAQLVGLNAGDSKEVTVTIPADFPLSDLREKEVVFAVTVKELKEAVLPELDDELAAKLAPGKTLEEIKTIIRDNMERERRRQIDDLKVNQIVEHFNTQVEFDVPEELLAQETQNQADAMVRQGIQSGLSQEEVEAQQTEIFANAGSQAKSNIKTNFILQEIARAENISVSDQELVNHLVAIANSRKQAPKKFIRDLQRSGRLPGVRNSMLVGKAIDFVVENAKVEETSEPLGEA